MPRVALHPCSYPGCTELVEHGRCPEHRHNEATYQRDPGRQRLYDRKWQKRRELQLSTHPWCEDCLDQGVYTPATDVHHLIPHRGDPLVFGSSPLRSLCHVCHSRHTIQEGRAPEKFPSGGCRAQVASDEKKIPNVENPENAG